MQVTARRHQRALPNLLRQFMSPCFAFCTSPGVSKPLDWLVLWGESAMHALYFLLVAGSKEMPQLIIFHPSLFTVIQHLISIFPSQLQDLHHETMTPPDQTLLRPGIQQNRGYFSCLKADKDFVSGSCSVKALRRSGSQPRTDALERLCRLKRSLKCLIQCSKTTFQSSPQST